MGADALVNSEQSDFLLAPAGASISAQIARRGGHAVQEELRQQTRGQTLPVGTVLQTRRGNLGRIFHAAIHEPRQLRVGAGGEPDILGVIEACLRGILGVAADDGEVRSVAIPLLGAGVFGLPPAFSGATVARTVARFALASELPAPLEVVLVVLPDRAGQQGLAAAVQVLLDEGSGSLPWEPLQPGVPLLAPLEREIARARDPRWRSMLLCRYAEVFTRLAWAILASGTDDRCQERLPLFARPVSFGTLAEWLLALASTPLQGPPVLQELARHCRERAGPLRSLVHTRNNLAHGRAALPLGEIEKDLREYIDAPRWRGPLQLPTEGGMPWVLSLPENNADSPRMALLERTSGPSFDRGHYLDPCTGITHTVDLPGAIPGDLTRVDTPGNHSS